MRLLVDFTQFYPKNTFHDHVNKVVNGHTSLTKWNRLVRYRSAKTGQVRYGEPVADLTTDIDQLAADGLLKVQPLEGSNWLSVTPSDEEEDDVKELLGPLTPKDVPVVRCTGLNYRSHSGSQSLLNNIRQTNTGEQFWSRTGIFQSIRHYSLNQDRL